MLLRFSVFSHASIATSQLNMTFRPIRIERYTLFRIFQSFVILVQQQMGCATITIQLGIVGSIFNGLNINFVRLQNTSL